MTSGLVRAARSSPLIMRLERCSRSEAFEHLQHAAEGVVSLLAAPPSASDMLGRPRARIPNRRSVSFRMHPLRHPALFGYLASRGIVPGIAAAYCREVRYQVRNHCFFAIGFRNDCGGWELRSERFKGSSSPKQITTVDHQSDKVIVFEGFMDFLACLSMKHPAPFGIDATVLNSVVNLPKALPFLERHPTIHAFLDNDEAGRRTLAELTRRCPRSQVIDHAHLYRDYKDLNDFWIARKRLRNDSEETKTESRKPQLRPKGGMKV